VAADVLGGRVDDDVRPVLEGPVEVGREGGVVDDEGDADLLRDLADLGEGEDVEARVAEAFAVEGLGVLLHGLAEVLGIVAVDERDLDAELGQGVVEEVVGAAVELGDRDDVVAGAGDVEDGRRDRRLTRRMGEGARAAFERREALLEDVRRRVHDAGVDVAEFLQAEEIGRVFRIPELVAGGLVDRDGARTGGRVRLLAGMEGFGA